MKALLFIAMLFAFSIGSTHAADDPEYKGFRVCTKCHDQQGNSWKKSRHAKAFESLKPGVHAEAKNRARLDPNKDYTQDKDCVGCHVTGFGQPSGFRIGMDPDDAKVLAGVGCEACHGAGGAYRQEHANAGDKLKVSGEATDRQVLIAARQNFDYEKACASCHLNYQGSKWAEAKPPFTPFTPEVDSKYHFDFGKAVHATGESNAVHTHYKLRGVFTGGTPPVIRAEIQKSAQEPEE
ncbi:cytochrome c family protein [Denitromonas sp.]|uniref:cytochrome c family protein n=1 Tax=Denitromonas sp. TaxID=2734609 RepID=UPI002AFE2D24|nr:cytochrome c family protein [Denitromonas sp.]